MVLQLTRVLGFSLAFVLAGVFVGPWTAPPVPHAQDPQVLPIEAHEVLATEGQEAPVRAPTEEEDDHLVVSHVVHQPPAWLSGQDTLRTHDALGPPLHSPDVETPPPRS